METVSEYFEIKVFDDCVMRSRLSKEAYSSLRKTIEEGVPLNLNLANAIASAMCKWAVENGATHYTHWFQPLTGITAEKHDSFINPAEDGTVIMKFSGKELIKGEPDASSFPSGGLRTTFEARGYTTWDPSSYAFIKENTLCIPTAFCSYDGNALDEKTPLLRSMEALNKQALRILKLFGKNNVKRVVPCVGVEQEYFLIDRETYLKRKDLIYCGRTLFGASPSKGQELADHYFGSLKPRVQAYMADLDKELWKLGVAAKTEHNEVAPAQHELAFIYSTANVATDHNQLAMEIMKKVARKHGLACLLHEKPFAGVSGSGKHNNWSLATDTGVNLLSPGETPYENAQFLLFLIAVIKAVDDYQSLLRLSIATAGNDHRLGGHEAPPSVISVFLGDELSKILDSIETGSPYIKINESEMQLGVDILPRFIKDTTDRNRTSPFAFTGNKFEFRMVGSGDSIACANVMLNAAVAESLRQFADELEKNKDDFNSAIKLLKNNISVHKRIIFNGNGYDDAWLKEAVEVRGLLNLRSTPEALEKLIDEKNVKMLVDNGIFSKDELWSRHEILLENYTRTVRIEALTMIEMVKREIIPALIAYSASTASDIATKKNIDSAFAGKYEMKLAKELTEFTDKIADLTDDLDKLLKKSDGLSKISEQASYICEKIIPEMNALRKNCDAAENITARNYWPFPTYGDLLFGV